jgi:predicted nucleotidyltransferase component of viral defense system
MIPEQEVHSLSRSLGVPLTHVEKDYVMGWMLWGMYSRSSLADRLVLKGGNCLRKVYFPETRFSDDLDFTATRLPSEAEFKHNLDSICADVESACGIPFQMRRTRVEEKATPDPDAKALDARVYFRGFAGDSSLTMRLKFDVSEYETIVLPIVHHPIIHNYSDAHQCTADIAAYAIEEVLAEKLRSWIQRTRARDLFDSVQIIRTHGSTINKRRILDAFLKKTLFKGIPRAGRDELLVGEKFETVERDWMTTIVCPVNALILARNAIELFRDFVEALFAAPIVASLGYRAAAQTYQRFATGLREAIIAAGRDRQTIFMTYDGAEREIEPYCFRYKIRKSDRTGHEYFYGYDRTRGSTIKSFFVSRIQSVRAAGRPFQPRFVVEF